MTAKMTEITFGVTGLNEYNARVKEAFENFQKAHDQLCELLPPGAVSIKVEIKDRDSWSDRTGENFSDWIKRHHLKVIVLNKLEP